MSLSENKYIFAIVDDFSRFTWVLFLVHKSDVLKAFKRQSKMITNEKKTKIGSIGSDKGSEFLNELFENFVIKKVFDINF